jgi:hypothetical protein
VIKPPQEYVIHVAQVSATEWIKSTVFEVSPAASWGEAVARRPTVSLAIVVAVVALVTAGRWLLADRLPPADHRGRLAADPIPADLTERGAGHAAASRPLRLSDAALLEKVALVSLVGTLFARVHPNAAAGPVAVTAGGTLMIVANTALGAWLARCGPTRASVLRELAVLAAANAGLILLYGGLLPTANESFDVFTALFFALLLT